MEEKHTHTKNVNLRFTDIQRKRSLLRLAF